MENVISLTEPDWSREAPRGAWDPGRKLLKSIRAYQTASGPFARWHRALAAVRHKFWSAVTSCDIPLNANIGGGLLMPHPIGIVVHPKAKVGINCLLMQNTTIGVVGGEKDGAPVLGAGCDLSAGSGVIGEVTLGDRSLVAANGVVTKDVPQRTIVAGVPAKPIGAR